MAFLRRGAGFHIKALNHVECYPPRANVPEFEPQIKRNAKEMEPYNPHRFVHGSVMAADHRLHNPQSWADGEEVDAIDWSSAERKSYYGVVHLNAVTKTPVNPFGRTGMCGRGLLGRWGPNHASDLIVTRTNPNDDSKTDFVAIKRRDNGEWALPGGMVNLGERVSNAAIREFKEEALRCLGKDDEEPNSEKRSAAESKAVKSLDSIISNGGDIIFKGYVDDPRNTVHLIYILLVCVLAAYSTLLSCFAGRRLDRDVCYSLPCHQGTGRRA